MLILGEFSTPFSPIYKSSRQKPEMLELTDGIHRTFDPIAKEYAFSACPVMTTYLNRKQVSGQIQKIEITLCILSLQPWIKARPDKNNRNLTHSWKHTAER